MKRPRSRLQPGPHAVPAHLRQSASAVRAPRNCRRPIAPRSGSGLASCTPGRIAVEFGSSCEMRDLTPNSPLAQRCSGSDRALAHTFGVRPRSRPRKRRRAGRPDVADGFKARPLGPASRRRMKRPRSRLQPGPHAVPAHLRQPASVVRAPRNCRRPIASRSRSGLASCTPGRIAVEFGSSCGMRDLTPNSPLSQRVFRIRPSPGSHVRGQASQPSAQTSSRWQA